MVSDKTPPHKRIKRAEKGREEWKVKATERREENQKLKAEIKLKDARAKLLSDEIRELKIRLEAAKNESSKRDVELQKFKKKIP
jgi:archaellum component FlaC